MVTQDARTRTWVPDWPCSPAQVLRPQRRGAGDPTQRHLDDGRIFRAMRTPVGPASLCVEARASAGEVHGRAWGPGADWALERMPALLGADDDPSGFEAHHHPEVAEGWRTHRHWRIGGTGLVMESLVPSILEQKVTGKQAFGSFRELVRRHGEPAPGPVAQLRLMVQPTPATIAAIPSWEWLRLGVQPAQSRTMVTACRLASSLERISAAPEEAERRLTSIRGIGVWTSAEVRMRALGDADAVSFGDYHLANWVGWALVGHDITDEEMGALLEPYRPQRGRAAAMAIAGGRSRPRRGPRMSVPTHLPTR
ncbi:3-methyladenine DNA glycosylase/8-oxoguanine DNA glycosylase [Nocardioides cavernae]|uniref:3-methyladenine DNA glycosylase/8-oxoguanine DNA glycosylase n=1 Tax=Nocardioides cavernae TaxID=1921566 RepID=A0A7Y9H5M4_9ACTN|nr:DNA-3-methyladenine glycosylase 2 family protein [Nocardioides cavernae]NYE38357.1 3-methyladenine DNA glycosylase/8-oxoguanine DNA glycosylase [Nocardioides cavernae]